MSDQNKSFVGRSSLRTRTLPELQALLKAKKKEKSNFGPSGKKIIDRQIALINSFISNAKLNEGTELPLKSNSTRENGKPRVSQMVLNQRNLSNRIKKGLSDLDKQFLDIDKTDERYKNTNEKVSDNRPVSTNTTNNSSRTELNNNISNVSRTQEGTDPSDRNMNALEKLASKILGKNVRLQVDSEFNDDGYMTEEQQYHNLNRGGAITPEQKKRMARIAKEYKAKRAKKVTAQPKVMQTKSNKGASPFSDMKKAMANGNRKRTNR